MSNNEKFKNVVHYICARCSDPKKLGATKLNKILLHVDLLSYLASGESVTNHTYVKRQYGPVPVGILSALGELESEGKIVVSNSDLYGLRKRDYFSVSDPDVDSLESHEIDLINQMIDYICDNHTASSISQLTHDVVWEAAEMGEEIPLYAFLAARSGEINDSDIQWADGLIEART